MASRRTAVLVYRWSKVHCHRLRSVWTLPVVTTTDEWGWRGWGKWRKLEFAQAGLFYSLNWRENRSKNKLVCEHAVAWLGTRELLLSGKLYKTRKTFLVFTSISNMHQEHVPTSLSTFSRATYFLLAGSWSELDFFVCLSEMYLSKKCEGCIAGLFIEMCARTVNMEKV